MTMLDQESLRWLARMQADHKQVVQVFWDLTQEAKEEDRERWSMGARFVRELVTLTLERLDCPEALFKTATERMASWGLDG